MNIRRFFGALWANKFVLLIILAIYAGMITCTYALRSKRPSAPPLDVVFVFDATGSMQDKIDGLLNTCDRFAGILGSTGSDYRLAMVTFGAIGEPRVIRETFESSKDVPGFQRFLGGVRADGGGSEDQPTAMKYALSHFKYRKDAKKILILVTDEPLFGDESSGTKPTGDWPRIIKDCKKRDFTAYAVCIPEEPYQSLARETGGRFYDIIGGGDFTDILMNIAKDINASITR